MTNEEKYKTPEEREKAFHEFCCKKLDCSVCEARYGATAKYFGRDHCVLRWLYMKAEEELLTCPFCGGDAKIEFIPSFRNSYFVRCKICLSSVRGYDTRDKAVAAWNRRVNSIKG